MKAAAVVLGALAIASAARAAGSAFTLDDLYRVRGVSDARISPDGRTIAYVVTASNLREGKRWSRLFLVNTDGSNPRPLTRTEKSDSEPRWSPDGRTIAFVSDRDGAPQIYLISPFGGEARKLTSVSSGVSGILWAPDGRSIAFASDVLPECGADDTCNAKAREAREKAGAQAHLADHLLYRHWTAWKDGTRTHVLLADAASGAVRDLTPGDWDSPTFQLSGPLDYAFSPDSRELCFVSNHDPDPESSTNTDLWIVPTAAGHEREARDITASNRAYDGNPQYSPDGRYIAYRTQSIPRYESDRFRLAVYDRESGKSRVLTESFDNWVDDFAWAPDSRALYFLGEVQGQTPLYRVAVASGLWREVFADKTIDSFDLSRDGGQFVYCRRSVARPDEVYGRRADGSGRREITFENAALEREVDIRPAETFWVEGAGGSRIQVFLVKPHGFDPKKKYPLILNVHGGPQGQWEDAFRGDWQVYPGAGYVVAFCNPHGSTGYGQAFTAEISGDWGGKVFDDLMRVSDALARLPYVDPDRMGAMGWSYGGYMMDWFEGHTRRFRAIASMMGVYDLTAMYGATEELWFPEWDLKGRPWDSDQYRRWSPSEFVRDFRTPCLVLTGERDFRVPYTQSLEFFTDLQKMGVPSRLIVFKHSGHWPNWKDMALYYDAHLDWFHRYLGGAAAPYDVAKMVAGTAFGEGPKK